MKCVVCFNYLLVPNMLGRKSECCFMWSSTGLRFCQIPSVVTSAALIPWPILTAHPQASFTQSGSFFFLLCLLFPLLTPVTPTFWSSFFFLLLAILKAFFPFLQPSVLSNQRDSECNIKAIHNLQDIRGAISIPAPQRRHLPHIPSVYLCLLLSQIQHDEFMAWKTGSMFLLWFDFIHLECRQQTNEIQTTKYKKLNAKLKKRHIYHTIRISFP